MNFDEENARAADLVRRAAAGDRSAEEELVRMFRGRVLVKLRRGCNVAERIRDMYQEVWLRVIEAIRNDRIAQPDHFCGFLCGVAQNVALEQSKHSKRPFVDLDVATALKHHGASAEELLDRQFLSRHVNGCLASMNERDREVVFRHYVRQDDKDDTCRQLGLTPVHYSRVLHRARKRLAGLLDASLGRDDLDLGDSPEEDSDAGCDSSSPSATDDEQD